MSEKKTKSATTSVTVVLGAALLVTASASGIKLDSGAGEKVEIMVDAAKLGLSLGRRLQKRRVQLQVQKGRGFGEDAEDTR